MSQITRNEVEALIEDQVIREIFDGVKKQSKALSLFRKLPNMSSTKTKIRVSDSLPVSYFLNTEGDNSGRKKLTKMAWKNKFITAGEVAVIIPIKEDLLDDADVDIWAEIKPHIIEAFGKTIDEAIFLGNGKPTDWRKGLIPSVVETGKVTSETNNLYDDISDTMSQVELSGYNPTALLGGVDLKGKFRKLTDTTGQPLQASDVTELPRHFMDNGVWDKSLSTMIVGDFSQAVYSIRQDMTYKVLTEAVIQDPETGEILYNLAQDDMVALRVVMRLGWEIPNPVNALDETETRFPFASLNPADGSL